MFYGTNTFQTPSISATLMYLNYLGAERAAMLKNLQLAGPVEWKANEGRWACYTLSMLRKNGYLASAGSRALQHDALSLPVQVGAKPAELTWETVVWKKLVDIEGLEIVGQGQDWSVECKKQDRAGEK